MLRGLDVNAKHEHSGLRARHPVIGTRSDTLIVIPALNESPTIATVLRDVQAAGNPDVLVVDDGSRDGTAEIARREGAIVVSHPVSLGYGAALQTGYKYADRFGYAFVVQMDADGQHRPADVHRLLTPLRAGEADVALGSRFVTASGYRMGAVRRVGRAFFKRMLVACGGPSIADPTTGFQALARRAFRFYCGDFYPADFPDIDVLLMVHRHGMRIVEVPVTMAPSPPARVPMHGGWRAIYYTYKMILSTLRNAIAPKRETETKP